MSNWVWFNDSVRAGIVNFDLVAGSGAYALTGGGTGFMLIAEGGAFALNGSAAPLYKGSGIEGAVTPYFLSGFGIGPFVRGFRLDSEHGEYKLGSPHAVLIKTSVPVKDPVPYVEQAWEQPENEGSDLDAGVEWEAG